MQMVCAKSLKQLQDYVEGEIYIYGARTVAMRTYDYLVNNGKRLKDLSFLKNMIILSN